MTQLTRKGNTLDWLEACKSSFQELKKRLTTSPILILPDPLGQFDVYFDVFYQGLECVMM